MFRTFRLQRYFTKFQTLYPQICYFNSAATTLRPDVVSRSLALAYRRFPFSINSIDNQFSAQGLQRLEAVRAQTAAFFGATPAEVIFTPSTTFSLNQVVYGLEHGLMPGDEIILSDLEHNANLTPWIALQNRFKVKIKYLRFQFPAPDYGKQLQQLLTKRTKILALSLVDNTISYHLPFQKLFASVRQFNPEIKIIADITQLVGKRPFGFQTANLDFACFSAHKMFGPFGLGVMLAKPAFQTLLTPFLKGSNSVLNLQRKEIKYNLGPAKFEGGTFALPTLIGFGAALSFLEKFSLAALARHLDYLYQTCLKGLRTIPQIEVFAHNQQFGSSLIFNFKTLNAHDVAMYLADVEKIILRSGNHCALLTPQIFQRRQTLRISFHFYNDLEDVVFLLNKLRLIAENPHLILTSFPRKLQTLLFNYGKIRPFPLCKTAEQFYESKNLTCADWVQFSLTTSSSPGKIGFTAEACLITTATINLMLNRLNHAPDAKKITFLQAYLRFFFDAQPLPLELKVFEPFGQLFYQKRRINCATFWAKTLLNALKDHVN